MITDICQIGYMPRIASLITCSEEDRETLERRAASRTVSSQAVERARIVLGCLAGERVKEIARRCHTRPNTVIKWRQRFAQHGLKGLEDAPRPGAKRVYDEDFRNRVLATLEKPPPVGQACWTARRWRRPSMARCMQSGGCCAKKVSACSASARGVSARISSSLRKRPILLRCI